MKGDETIICMNALVTLFNRSYMSLCLYTKIQNLPVTTYLHTEDLNISASILNECPGPVTNPILPPVRC